MSYLRFALFCGYYYYYIETQRQVFEFVFFYEKICSFCHSLFFCSVTAASASTKFSFALVLTSTKTTVPPWFCHNKVYFSCSAGEISHQGFIALFFQKFFTLFLSPSAEQTSIRQQFFCFVAEKHRFYELAVVCSVRFSESLTLFPLRCLR